MDVPHGDSIMSEDATGSEAIDPQAGGESPQAAANGVPAQQPEQKFMQIPADRFADWDGRYGDAIRDAKAYRQAQQSGVFDAYNRISQLGLQDNDYEAIGSLMTALKQNGIGLADFVQYWTSPEGQGQEGEQQQAQAALTPEELKAAVAEAMAAERQKYEQQTAQQARQQEIAQSRQAETAAAAEVIKKAGIPDDSPLGKHLQRVFSSMVIDHVAEAIPSWYSPQQRQQALQEAYSGPVSADVIAKAAQQLEAAISDLRNLSVADFAKKQQQLPGGSLGGGAGGGRTAPKNLTGDALLAYMSGENP